MSKIEVGRYSDLFRRYLSMKGQTVVAAELAPEISPVFVIESERPDWHFLKGEKIISGAVTVTGVAAVQSTARLRNPVGSGILAVVSRIFLSPSAGNTVFNVFLNTQTVDLATVFPLIPVTRDTRWALVTSAIIASGDNVGGTGSNILTGSLLDSTVNQFDLPLVLSPGNSVDINFLTVARNLRAAVLWVERRVDALEL